MKKLSLLLAAAAIVGCASNDPKEEQLAEIREEKIDRVDEVLDNVPDWFTEAPTSVAGIYGVGTATSENMQFSLSKAKLQATYNIAAIYSQSVSGNQKSFSRETEGVGSSYQSTDKLIIDQLVKNSDVSGSAVEETEIFREGTGFRTYVLMFYPTGENNIVKQSKAREQMVQQADQSLEEAHKQLMDRIKEEEAKEPVSETPSTQI